jgi:hypothetical protein
MSFDDAVVKIQSYFRGYKKRTVSQILLFTQFFKDIITILIILFKQLAAEQQQQQQPE